MIQSHLAKLISELDCADVKAEVDSELSVRLTGYIDSQKNHSELLRDARTIDGVGRVTSAVTVQPWPRCGLDGLAAWATFPDFRITPNKLDKPYKIGQDLISFRVVPPPGRQGFLNMVFLQSDRTAWHYEPWSQVEVRLGDKELKEKDFGKAEKIGLEPPAGKMAIVAVFSFQPLTLVTFDKDGQVNQSTKDYFANLKQILAGNPGSIVSYTVFDTIQ